MKKLLIGLLTVLAFTLAIGLVTACSKAEELLTLESPEIRGYEPETGTLSWSPVSGAESYEISFDDGVNQTTNTVKSNQVKFTTDAEQFSFSITAKGSLHKDSPTVSATFIRLESDIVLSVDENGLITWDPVDDATGYSVSVDGKESDVITDTEYTVKEGAKHTVKVKPVKANSQTTYYYSFWSDSVSVRLLGSVQPKNIKYEDGKITWTKVANAVGYRVTIDGEEDEVPTNEYSYTGGDSFDVTVQALGDGNTYYNGAVSDAKSFIYLPVVERIWIDDDGNLVWDKIEKATGYSVKVNNNSQPKKVNECKYTGLSAGVSYTISVMPTGSAADAEYFSSWSEPTSVYILEAPVVEWTAGLDVSGEDAANALHWNIINGAEGYGYRLTTPGTNGQAGEVVEDTLGSDQNFFGHAFNEVGTYKFEVKALGEDGNGVYDSAYSQAYTIIRLAAPSRPSVTSNPESLAEGFAVSFSPVANARQYRLYKDRTETNYTTTTPQFRVTTDIVEETNTGEIEIAYNIRSVGYTETARKTVVLSSMLDNVSESGAGFTVTVLATPQDTTIDGYEYSFTGVPGTSNYNLQISGQNNPITSESVDLNRLISTGTSQVKVCAMGNGKEVLASTFSTSIEIQRLNAPTGIKISVDQSDGVLSFDGDNRADSYQATFTGRSEPLTVDTTTNVKEYIHETATIVVMYSVANRFYDPQETVYYMTSVASNDYTFLKLSAPTNINFDNDHMTWNKPGNLGTSSFTPTYNIYNGSNGVLDNGSGFTGNSYPLSTLEGGKIYSFGIVAVGDGVQFINSDMANSRSITKLETPTLVVNTTDFCYEWESVASASNYALTIDGEIVKTDIHQSGTKYTYTPHYDSLGNNHYVTLQALGNNGETTVSSSLEEYQQNVAQLQTPAFEYKYSSDCYSVDGKITVNITKETDYPNGYFYTIGTASHFSEATTYEENPNTSGIITISVYARGGSFDEAGTYYVDSQSAATVTLNLLGKPNNIDVNQDGVITWGRVTGALGYIYKLHITGTDGQQYLYEGTITSNEARLDLSKSFTVKVGDTDETKIISYKDISTMWLELQAKGNLSANLAATSDGSVNSEVTTRRWDSALH